jgi:lysophospholipase L1-like esterase
MNGRASVMGNTVAGGSSSIGFAFRSVVVEEVLPGKNICNTMDVQTGEKVQVGLNKRGTDSWPQTGDRWILNKSMAGHWILAIKITPTQPPVASGNLDTIDPDLESLLLVLEGLGLVQVALGHNGLGWQNPTSLLNTGWAIGPASGIAQPLRFRITTQKLELVGAVHTTSSSPNANLMTLPGPTPVSYWPATPQRVGCVANTSGTPSARWVEISTAGVVTIQNALAASSVDVYLDVSVPRTLLP